ncbi:hypothetical protein OG787_15665 [Streptomyces sp. NBC_00075]|uniref:COG4315 family predicted lipoprotein n=1 Tax=Streptomyces sp. NBC_00075 TaxID=2975641 RepID=UPI003253703A
MRARITLVAIPLALLSLSACGGADKEKETGGASSSGKGSARTSVEVADSGLGDILVDQDGRTLYAFTKDKAGAGNCDADCIAVWPALTSTAAATAGPGTDRALLGEAKNAGGAVQATYGDWPLYYYVGDAAPGDVNGQGLDGEWFVVKADGKMIKE